jgi:Tol biopolymer transport system component
MARSGASIACARSPASLCVVGEPTDNRKQLVFTAFDLLKGRGAELAKAGMDANENPVRWDLSPDGTRIAVCSSPQGPIRVLALDGRPTLEIRVKGWSNTRSLGWAADGNALLVGDLMQGTAALLHVDLRGNARVLWQQQGSRGLSGRPSPDGRSLAIEDRSVGVNMWMMENF